MDPVTFLLARLDEEVPRHTLDCALVRAGLDMFGDFEPCDCGAEARVLREVEAKRRIVGLHCVSPESIAWEDGVPFGPDCPECRMSWPCPTTCLLTLPFSDHPDYDPKWVQS